LRGGRSPWFVASPQPPRHDINESITCDVLIVGAGITGSLVAERLTRQGLDVVIIDREIPGRGSTAASTSMLLWEIDRPLTTLSEYYGLERAARGFRASYQAVHGLQALVAMLGIPCELRRRSSIYLASGSDGAELLEEHRLRRRVGLPGEYLDHGTLLDAFGLSRAGAIVSPGAADADPLQLSRGLLQVAAIRGARLFDAEAIAFDAADVAPRLARAGEADQAESLPELPTKLSLGLRHFLTLISHGGRAAQCDVRLHKKGRIAEGCRILAP